MWFPSVCPNAHVCYATRCGTGYRTRTDNFFLVREIRSQLRQSCIMVGQIGFEPMTFRVSDEISTTELLPIIWAAIQTWTENLHITNVLLYQLSYDGILLSNNCTIILTDDNSRTCIGQLARWKACWFTSRPSGNCKILSQPYINIIPEFLLKVKE